MEILILEKIFTLLLCIILIVSSPLICILIILPILLFRKLVAKVIAPCLRPDLGKILTCQTTNYTHDDPYNKAPEQTIISAMVIEGQFPLDLVRSIFVNRLLQLKLPNGDLRYLELMSYWVDWMGFRFWKKDANFDINNHTSICKPTSDDGFVSDEQLHEIRQNLLEVPFKRNFSPWDLLLIHNYRPSLEFYQTESPLSVILFRSHHAIGDGFSLIKAFQEGILGEEKFEIPISEKSPQTGVANKSSMTSNILNSLIFPFRCFYEFSGVLTQSMKPNPWKFDTSEPYYPCHASPHRISMSRIQTVRKHLGVRVSSVIFAICAAALREIMIKKGMKSDFVRCMFPFPLPGHPDKLRNHLTYCEIQLPVGSKTSSAQRLRLINESYDNLRQSTIPFSANVTSLMTGALFVPMGEAIYKAGFLSPVLISNVPGYSNVKSFKEGYKVLDYYFVVGLQNFLGVGMDIISYNGYIRIVVNARSTKLSKEEVDEMVLIMNKELNLLESEANMTIKIESV